MTRAKTERNNAMLAAYDGGMTLMAVADAFTMSRANAYRILDRMGAFDDRQRICARIAKAMRQRADNPVWRSNHSAAMRECWRQGRMPGKRRLFADDTERRRDYITTRKVMGAAYARQAFGIAP